MNFSQARKKNSLGYIQSTRKISFLERGTYKIFAPKSLVDDQSILESVKYPTSPKMMKNRKKFIKSEDKRYNRQSLNSSKLDIKQKMKLVELHNLTHSAYKHLNIKSFWKQPRSPKMWKEPSNVYPKLEIFNTSKFSKIDKIPSKSLQKCKAVVKISPIAIRVTPISDTDSSSDSSLILFPKLSPSKK